MECVDDGAYIITLAIQTHGKVIDLNLSPDTASIFDDVRLFSKAGEFEDAMSSHSQDQNILKKVNKLFQHDIRGASIDLMNEYVEYSHPIYKQFLEQGGHTLANNNVCRLFDNITFDKSLSMNTLRDGNRFSCMVDQLLNLIDPELNGIFVVSVHQKINDNEYKLICPDPALGYNLNLLKIKDFKEFASAFTTDTNILRALVDKSSNLPTEEYIRRYDILMKENKPQLLEEENNRFFELLKKWSITMQNAIQIESIRLSTLVDTIKQIIGAKCKINLLDYSCNSITRTLPVRDRNNAQYLVSSDIENPPKRWGGKRTKKIKTIKKKIKTRKTRKTQKTIKKKIKTRKTNIR